MAKNYKNTDNKSGKEYKGIKEIIGLNLDPQKKPELTEEKKHELVEKAAMKKMEEREL